MDASRLHKLLVFTEIVASGSLTGAARTLSVSKSVISEHLSGLEEDLGVRLLERTTRQIRLTQVGEHVLEASRRMVAAGQDAVSAAESSRSEAVGRLRVACTVGVLDELMVPVLTELRTQHPRLQIELEPDDTSIDIVRERIDVAVRVGVPRDSSWVRHSIADDDEIIVAPVHSSPRLAPRTLEALAQLPRIAHSEAEPAQKSRFFHSSGREAEIRLPTPVIRVRHSGAMRELIVAGNGLGILPRFMVQRDIDAGRLKHVLRGWRRRRIKIYALMPSRRWPRRTSVFLNALDAMMTAPRAMQPA